MSKPKLTDEERKQQELARLIMSARDFQQSLSANTFLREECDWDEAYNLEQMRRFQCYETTMVVAYARPFSASRGKAAPFRWKLLPNFSLLPQEVELHEKIIDHRNRLHAHSDSEFTRVRPEIWRTIMPDGEAFDFLRHRGGETLCFSEDDVRVIYKLLWKITTHIGDALQEHQAPRDTIPVVEIGHRKRQG